MLEKAKKLTLGLLLVALIVPVAFVLTACGDNGDNGIETEISAEAGGDGDNKTGDGTGDNGDNGDNESGVGTGENGDDENGAGTETGEPSAKQSLTEAMLGTWFVEFEGDDGPTNQTWVFTADSLTSIRGCGEWYVLGWKIVDIDHEMYFENWCDETGAELRARKSIRDWLAEEEISTFSNYFLIQITIEYEDILDYWLLGAIKIVGDTMFVGFSETATACDGCQECDEVTSFTRQTA